MMQIVIHSLVAPNEVCPKAEVVPKPVACVAAGVPKAGGADVAGVLKEKFPNAANGSYGSKHKLKHNQQKKWRTTVFGGRLYCVLTLCRCAGSNCTRITKIKTHYSVY